MTLPCDVCLYRRLGFDDGPAYPVHIATHTGVSIYMEAQVVVCAEHLSWVTDEPAFAGTLTPLAQQRSATAMNEEIEKPARRSPWVACATCGRKLHAVETRHLRLEDGLWYCDLHYPPSPADLIGLPTPVLAGGEGAVRWLEAEVVASTWALHCDTCDRSLAGDEGESRQALATRAAAAHWGIMHQGMLHVLCPECLELAVVVAGTQPSEEAAP